MIKRIAALLSILAPLTYGTLAQELPVPVGPGVTPSGTFTPGDVIVGGPGATQVQDALKYRTNGGFSLSASSIPAYNNCFWNDVDSCITVNVRMRERVFIGNAVLMTDSSSTCCSGTWLGTNSTTGSPIYLARDAQFVVMQDRGTVALSGMTRSSDGGTTSPREPIGTAGYALVNPSGLSGEQKLGWGMYSQCDNAPTGGVTTSQCNGMEIDTVNYGTNQTADPYGTGFGTFNLWIAAGGGQSPTNPSNAAMVFAANGTTFNEGIIFSDGSLTKTGGNSTAIAMGQGATFRWYISAGNVGALIRSTVATVGDDVQLVFSDNQWTFYGNGNAAGTFIVQHVSSGVNGLLIDDAATGSPALIRPIGADSIVGIDIHTKSTGLIRLYPGADVAAAVTIQNAAKNKTYLSVDTSGNNVSLPQITTGTPAASVCIDASNNLIKKTTTGSCV